MLGFWIRCSHGESGLSGLCRQLPHRVVDDNFWIVVETGLGRIPDLEFLGLVQRLRTEISRCLAESEPPCRVTEREPDLKGFMRLVETVDQLDPVVMQELDSAYQPLAPQALHRVAQYIRERGS